MIARWHFDRIARCVSITRNLFKRDFEGNFARDIPGIAIADRDALFYGLVLWVANVEINDLTFTHNHLFNFFITGLHLNLHVAYRRPKIL